MIRAKAREFSNSICSKTETAPLAGKTDSHQIKGLPPVTATVVPDV
jgi:hypothetical protein